MGIMFAPDMLELVLSGKKTQTRRQVKHGQSIIELYADPNEPDEIGCVVDGGGKRDVKKWRVGNTYAIQPGRGKKGVGRVRILSIRLERFCDISQADAVAEGFTDPAGFYAKIRELYGDDFDLSQPCWCLTFELIRPLD